MEGLLVSDSVCLSSSHYGAEGWVSNSGTERRGHRMETQQRQSV